MKLQEFSYYNPVIVFLHPGKKKSTYSFSVFVRGSVLDISLEAYLNKSSKWRVLTHEEQAPTQDQNCWKKKGETTFWSLHGRFYFQTLKTILFITD